MTRLTMREARVLKILGVSEAGLTTCFRLRAGYRISGGTAGEKLERQGYVTPWRPETGRTLMPAGHALLKAARDLGW